MISRVSIYQLTCDCCGAVGPSGPDAGKLVQEAVLVGYEIVFEYVICPPCSEQGRLPEDVEDMAVGLPATGFWPGYPDPEHFGSVN